MEARVSGLSHRTALTGPAPSAFISCSIIIMTGNASSTRWRPTDVCHCKKVKRLKVVVVLQLYTFIGFSQNRQPQQKRIKCSAHLCVKMCQSFLPPCRRRWYRSEAPGSRKNIFLRHRTESYLHHKVHSVDCQSRDACMVRRKHDCSVDYNVCTRDFEHEHSSSPSGIDNKLSLFSIVGPLPSAKCWGGA